MQAEQVIIRPVVTEKSARLAQFSQYVFVVHPDVNKIEVADAVQRLFKVKVTAVRTLNSAGKRKRRGMRWVRRPSVRRAIVTVAKGQRIDVSTLK